MKKILFVILPILMLTGCLNEDNSQSYSSEVRTHASSPKLMAQSPSLISNREMVANDSIELKNDLEIKNETTKIEKRYNITFELLKDDLVAKKEKDIETCLKYNCVILNNNISNNDYSSHANLNIKISPKYVDNFIEDISDNTIISNQSMNAIDRSLEYIDIEGRLDTKKNLKKKLEELLDSDKYTSINNILEIQKEIAKSHAEIEVLERQLRYLKNVTSNVHIDISYIGKLSLVGEVDTSPIQKSLDNFGDNLSKSVAALILVVSISIPWVLLSIVSLFILFGIIKVLFIIIKRKVNGKQKGE